MQSLTSSQVFENMSQHWHSIRRGGNATALVFVHGLQGHVRETWAGFPEQILSSSTFDHCDLVLWGYPTRVLAKWNLPFTGHKLPALETLAKQLGTDLANPDIAGAYADLVLVAHSQGGLLALDLVLSLAETDPLRSRLRALVLYATPTRGIESSSLGRFFSGLLSGHVRDLRSSSSFIQELSGKLDALAGAGALGAVHGVPVRAVVALEDNAVTEQSAKARWKDVVTAPGNHVELVKPDSREHPSVAALRQVVEHRTLPRFVRGKGEVTRANLRLVEEAEEDLYAVGSRSRDPAYLARIEEALAHRPKLRYTRALLGPPRRPELLNHLKAVLGLRDPGDRRHGYQTVQLALYEHLERQFEFNLIGNEKRCLVVLPSAEGKVSGYDSALVVSEPALVQGYRSLAAALCEAGRPLRNLGEVEKVAVVP
jgi:pimeloyl-ACP methyl ester carboxylesterase